MECAEAAWSGCLHRIVTATYLMQRSALDWKIMKFQKGKQRFNVEIVYTKRQ